MPVCVCVISQTNSLKKIRVICLPALPNKLCRAMSRTCVNVIAESLTWKCLKFRLHNQKPTTGQHYRHFHLWPWATLMTLLRQRPIHSWCWSSCPDLFVTRTGRTERRKTCAMAQKIRIGASMCPQIGTKTVSSYLFPPKPILTMLNFSNGKWT